MLRLLLIGSGLATLALSARAQSIKIDLQPAGSPYGVPSPTYGASNGRIGIWNAVSSTPVSNLTSWDGSPTNVSLSTTAFYQSCGPGQGMFLSFDHPTTSGEDERLLDDMFGSDETDVQWVFHGLRPGDYDVDTIILGIPGCDDAYQRVTVAGSPDPLQWVYGTWSGTYVQGAPSAGSTAANFARHRMTVTDGTIQVRITNFPPGYYQFVNSILLDFHEPESVGTSLCFGDDTVAPCPCLNAGQLGAGCDNSAATGGSWLFANGSTSPDAVVLHASRELPNALSIFLQGDQLVPAIPYGDGLRCTGGALRRLYTKSAQNGVVYAPQAGDDSIAARSASLGVPILPGSTRYYQVYYRDANPGFCSPPQGNTFNVSNAVKIDW